MNNKSFDQKRIAEGYANRPWLHKSVMEQLRIDCNIEQNFRNGLDVGCGAGLSTKALNLICDKVTGTDISDSMIQVCKAIYKKQDYSFYVAGAEETPQPEDLYDVVTAAGVINWIDKERFLKNMHDVMEPGGLLVIYDFWITDKMKDNNAYSDWYQNKYLHNFPKPPRDESVWTQKDLGMDFIMKKQVTYEMEYEFTLDSFTDFMMIQSNVNVPIAEGKKTEKEVRDWLQETLQPIFKNQKKILIFSGYSWYIKYL